MNGFARILKGGSTLRMPEIAEFNEKFLTRKHDFSSLQRSPCWIDPSQVDNRKCKKKFFIFFFHVSYIYAVFLLVYIFAKCVRNSELLLECNQMTRGSVYEPLTVKRHVFIDIQTLF